MILIKLEFVYMLHTLAVTKGKLICFTEGCLNKKRKEFRHFDHKIHLRKVVEIFNTLNTTLSALSVGLITSSGEASAYKNIR